MGHRINLNGIGAVHCANIEDAVEYSIENDSGVQDAILAVNKNKGWFANPAALRAAHPTGSNGEWAIVGSTDTVWVWDTDSADWVDSGLGSLVTSVDGETGAVDGRYTNVIFFGKGGSDTNDGKSYIQRLLTLGAAITAAAALTPAADNIITIKCEDSGIYTENYTSADYVNLYAPCAVLNGTITISHDTYMHLSDVRNNITVDAGKVLKAQILEHSSGSVTNNGTIRGRIDDQLYGISGVQLLV